MNDIWINLLIFLLLLLYIIENLVKGSKVLIDGKELLVFPYSLVKIIAKIFKREYSPNPRSQRQFIFWGVFYSGVIVGFLPIIILVLVHGLSNLF